MEAVEQKRMKLRSFAIHQIFDDSVCSSRVKLTEMHAIAICDKKNIPQILSLAPRLPQNYHHLKRINGEMILISDNLSTIEDAAKEKLLNFAVNRCFTQVKVPTIKPRTRAQFLFTKDYWPSSFHVDKELEKKLCGIFFDDHKLKVYTNLLLRVEPLNGGLVYDPHQEEIVVNATGNDPSHLLRHPAMCLINFLAASQLNASLSLIDDEQQYLATGLDIILFKEPCTMCAMALVHARANRVFFCEVNPRQGALLSKWRLQEAPNINHRYEVFQFIEEL